MSQSHNASIRSHQGSHVSKTTALALKNVWMWEEWMMHSGDTSFLLQILKEPKNLFFNSSWQALPWDVTTICCLLEMQTQSDSLSTFNAAEWSLLYHCTRTSSDRPLFLDLHPRPDKESCHIRGRIDDLSFPFIFHKGWWNGNERNSQGAGCKGSQWG